MRKFKMYKAIIDDGKNVSRAYIPAVDRRDVRNFCHVNGEIVGIVDYSEKYPISTEQVRQALLSAGFGEPEADTVARLVGRTYTNSVD